MLFKERQMYTRTLHESKLFQKVRETNVQPEEMRRKL